MLLKLDLQEGTINDETAPRDADNMITSSSCSAQWVQEEDEEEEAPIATVGNVEALRHDLQIHQTPVHQGPPRWEGSEVQQLIREVVRTEAERPKILPRELWLSNEAYKILFDLEAFRQYIHQERHRQRFQRFLNK
jgi:hypothetical protein